MICSLLSFRSLLKCYLFKEAFQDILNKITIPSLSPPSSLPEAVVFFFFCMGGDNTYYHLILYYMFICSLSFCYRHL